METNIHTDMPPPSPTLVNRTSSPIDDGGEPYYDISQGKNFKKKQNPIEITLIIIIMSHNRGRSRSQSTWGT